MLFNTHSRTASGSVTTARCSSEATCTSCAGAIDATVRELSIKKRGNDGLSYTSGVWHPVAQAATQATSVKSGRSTIVLSSREYAEIRLLIACLVRPVKLCLLPCVPTH